MQHIYRVCTTPSDIATRAAPVLLLVLAPTRHGRRRLGSSRSGGEGAHHMVDAGTQRRDVVWLDRREHGDPQLVAPELAIRLGVHDPVLPQHGTAPPPAPPPHEVDCPH